MAFSLRRRLSLKRKESPWNSTMWQRWVRRSRRAAVRRGSPCSVRRVGREVLRFSLAAHLAAKEGRAVALAEMG